MASNGENGPRAIVTGDVTMDWNLAQLPGGDPSAAVWNPDDVARICFQPGGAALLADVIHAVGAKQYEGMEVYSPVRPSRRIRPADAKYHHSYAQWAPFANPGQAMGAGGEVWRVKTYLGLDPVRNAAPPAPGDPRLVVGDPEAPDLVVLDDAHLGFRDEPGLWPKSVRDGTQAGWTVVKIASPVAGGALWKHLLSTCTDRLVAVTTIGDLRQTEVHISQGLSWERTAQDLFWELTNNPDVNSLSLCRHAVVSLGPDGALLLSRIADVDEERRRPSWRCRLIFDPTCIEGSWRRDYPGGLIGYTTCLVAGIVARLMSGEEGDLGPGVSAGISAMRALHCHGYGERTDGAALGDCALAFPTEKVVGEVISPSREFPAVDVQEPDRFLWSARSDEAAAQGGEWTILDEVCAGAQGIRGAFDSPLAQAAARVVEEGIESVPELQCVPVCVIGKLSTIDRREAEGYRRVQKLIAQYCRGSDQTPLAIGVFGPPGSGKSFGVEQVAQSVPDVEIETCEFNLSQFEGPRDLISALHQVRDVNLEGKMPLVFWDEFDTTLGGEAMGWLPYFLAPIQDGAFRDGQLKHHIGRAIFVFAGGTCATMAEFDRGRAADFVNVKGPDFVSRLKGHVDIMGPNCQDDALCCDRHYLLRRAVALRSLIMRDARQLLSSEEGKTIVNMDSGVLRAFLHIGEYKHGLRSLQAIIGMSALAGKKRYERSSLPDATQLDLHVNGLEFSALAQLETFDMPGDGEHDQPAEQRRKLLHDLAAATHEVYEGALAGAPGIPYASLSPDLQEQNLSFVRDILPKIIGIGYQMQPARSDEPPIHFPGEHLEYLAEMEHERWLRLKLEQGWRWGKKRGKRANTNPSMVPWEKLSDEEHRLRYGKDADRVGAGPLPDATRDLDREMVRGIPRILARAGYTLINLREATSGTVREQAAAVRIGVTGHRFLAEEEKLRESVDTALRIIRALYADREPAVVSPLAEGADRMVVRAALARGAQLVAPLPLPLDDYLEDFAQDESKAEFRALLNRASEVIQLPLTVERNQAYEQAGMYVLDNCDVLIAIYDGRPAQGRGGTADIVRRALARGTPVLHIKAGNRKPGTNEPTTLGDEQGQIVVHNL